LRHGRYEIAPGLNRFGKDLGGGDADAKLFQIDRTFPPFRAEKLASRGEDLGKYVCVSDAPADTLADVARFIIKRLVTEHPTLFRGDATGLTCALTNETLTFDADMHLTSGGGGYADALDALACQVQEDLAIVSTAPQGGRGHWLAAAHVCFPNGWAPGAKVGHSFAAIHEPVAGMAEMNQRGEEFVSVMTRAIGGLVRFAWGVTFDDRLNHHPDKPRTPFDPANPRAFLRVERQTIWGMPAREAGNPRDLQGPRNARGASLFTIRTYLYDCAALRRDPATRDPLVAALLSMSPESRVYKGLGPHFDDLARWLSA
jgi:hypothetical protein